MLTKDDLQDISQIVSKIVKTEIHKAIQENNKIIFKKISEEINNVRLGLRQDIKQEIYNTKQEIYKVIGDEFERWFSQVFAWQEQADKRFERIEEKINVNSADIVAIRAQLNILDRKLDKHINDPNAHSKQHLVS